MRIALVFALCSLGAFSGAQMPIPVEPIKPFRTVKELMVASLDDPAVQVNIHVSPLQRQLQQLRLTELTMKFGFALVRSTLDSKDEGKQTQLALTFLSGPGKTLFPLLAANQVAMLRRISIKNDPLSALGTEEVAFALDLTAAQRAKIEAIRAKRFALFLDPKRPSIKLMNKALAELAQSAGKGDDSNDDEGLTVEKLDVIEPVMRKLLSAIERSARLSATEKFPPEPDALKLLTPKQRARFKELVALEPEHAGKTKR